MKKIITLLILILGYNLSYSQKYYGSIGPCFSFDTSVKEYKGLIGGGIEVGRMYFFIYGASTQSLSFFDRQPLAYITEVNYSKNYFIHL